MVVTVTFNPALDYITKVEKLQLGKTNRTTEESLRIGGKAINVALVLKELSIPVRAYTFVGGYTGNMLIEMLKEEQLPLDVFCCKGNTRINVKVKEKEETEINGQGIVIEDHHLQGLLEKLKGMDAGDYLVLSGSVPRGMSPMLYADLMRLLQDKELKIVVDATGQLLYNTLQFRPFLIKPNVQELEELFQVKIESLADIVQYAKELQKLGASNVLVSMGGDGALLLTEKGEIMQCSSPKGDVQDTVGAGDSMVAGFIAKYIQTNDYKQAFQFAIATGSATAFSSWLAKEKDILQLYKKIGEVKYENL